MTGGRNSSLEASGGGGGVLGTLNGFGLGFGDVLKEPPGALGLVSALEKATLEPAPLFFCFVFPLPNGRMPVTCNFLEPIADDLLSSFSSLLSSLLFPIVETEAASSSRGRLRPISFPFSLAPSCEVIAVDLETDAPKPNLNFASISYKLDVVKI